MSGVHRFLSRREKKAPRRSSPAKDKDSKPTPTQPTHRPDHFGGVFTIDDDPAVKPDKDEEKKIQGVLERLQTFGVNTMVESNARYALRISSPQGDGEAAFRLLMLLQETYEGLVLQYKPNTKLLGAVNRDSVTCYLDALLFGMFARLDSFEAMLYDSFDDLPRRKLAGLLRLWVNMLRTGRLITTDITRHLQDALSQCGWDEAASLKQQDPSEAFTFITGQLELPLLTLKMDLYHTGKEEPADDHKFVNERLLEVAIIDEPPEGGHVITLEDCLEHYFNNRIEVKRHMENQRRNTLKSAAVANESDTPTKMEKEPGIHVEVAELGASSTDTPMVETPVAEPLASPWTSKGPSERARPTIGRKRGDSIFSARKVELVGIDPEKLKEADAPLEKERKMSTKTEVLMPAWQFFKLLPWYTDHMPTSDAQVAAHFAKKRPVLGICLKRYSYTETGQATRLNTYIDIPLEIAVPNFVSDDNMQESGPLVGNFRLMLQSVVCHRGVSVNSGHYVCLSRGKASNAHREPEYRRDSSSDSEEGEDPWMRFDDLARDRVTYVDIREALKQETPYLLFYQVQPIGYDEHSIDDLPSYAEATSRSQSDVNPSEKPYLDDDLGSDNALEQVSSTTSANGGTGSEAIIRAPAPSARPSLEITTTFDPPRGRPSTQGNERRRSTTLDTSNFTDSVSGGSIRTDPTTSVPSTPLEEKDLNGGEKNVTGLLAVANKFTGSRRGSRVSKESTSKSRPTSTGPDSNGHGNGHGNRFNLNMSKLTQRMSRDNKSDTSTAPAPAPTIDIPTAVTTTEVTEGVASPGGRIKDQAATLVSARTDQGRESVDTTKAHDSGLMPPPSKAATTLMTKKEKAAMKQEKRHSKRKGGEDDRDCVVM